MTEKQTITLDEEANQPIGRVEPPTLALSKRTLCLAAAALIMFFGAGLLAGAYGIDTSEDPSSDYKAVGQTILTADTPRAVYSITPVSLGENRKGRKRMAMGDPMYSDPTDPEFVVSDTTEDRRGRVRIVELQGGKWQAVGQDLFGFSERSAFGYAVDLSSDGSTLAVGARSHDGISMRRGAVYVFTFDDEGNVWKLRGDKPATDDSTRGDYAVCGSSVSISNDGTMVAFSCGGDSTAFLSTFDNNVWVETLIAESVSEQGDLTLSVDGMSVLLTVEGDARVIDRVDTEWLVRGEIDDAQTVAQVDALQSNSVQYAMSKDAFTLAALFHTTDGNTMIRTFTFNGRIWKQFGMDMVVSPVGKDVSMTNLVLSDNGRKLAMSLTANVPRESTELHTFEYSWGTWEESGKPVVLRSRSLDVDMSSSGSMIALSYNEGTDVEDFVVRTLQQDH